MDKIIKIHKSGKNKKKLLKHSSKSSQYIIKSKVSKVSSAKNQIDLKGKVNSITNSVKKDEIVVNKTTSKIKKHKKCDIIISSSIDVHKLVH